MSVMSGTHAVNLKQCRECLHLPSMCADASGDVQRWPGGIIPYVLSQRLSSELMHLLFSEIQDGVQQQENKIVCIHPSAVTR